jgi:hypothetical protein
LTPFRSFGWGDKNKFFNFQTRIVSVVYGDFENVAVKLEVRIILGDFQLVGNGIL